MIIRFLLLLTFLQSLISTQCSDLNVGSIFTQRYHKLTSYNDKQLATLTARRVFQEIVPPATTPDRVDDRYVQQFLQFVETAVGKIRSSRSSDFNEALLDALADTLGGYMRTELLPNAKYAYYAGTVTYGAVRNVNDLYEEVKIYLNTLGRGWKMPKKLDRRHAFIVDKIDIDPRSTESCSELITEIDSNGCIKVPMPILDEADMPSSIALAIKNNTLMSLFSQRSSQALVRFYRMGAECILLESTVPCRSQAFSRFNRDLCEFIKNDVTPHLADERWYVGFGGILQVTAAVHDFCDLNQPTIFSMKRRYIEPKRRHKDQVYRQYNHFLLVQTVIAMAVAIWVFISLVTCYVNKRKQSRNFKKFNEKDQNVMTAYSSHQGSRRRSLVETTSPLKMESVYDMNEQVMKQLPVPDCAEIVHIQEVDVKKSSASDVRSTSAVSQKSSPALCSRSPPRIDTSMAQLTLSKNNRSDLTPGGGCRPLWESLSILWMSRCDETQVLATYSMSEVTSASRSAARNYKRRVPCTSAKGEYSSSSWTSSSGTSLQTEARRGGGARSAVARIAKDLAWAKRLAQRRKRNTEAKDNSAYQPDLSDRK